MNVLMNTTMTVTQTRYAPTLKDLTFVAVFEVTKETADAAQVHEARFHVGDTSECFNITFEIFEIVNFVFTTDVDECARPETNGCDANALCTNTEGSYVCRCLRGYSGDGRNCTGKTI